MADRPKAGPADDATRKRMLAQRLAEKEPEGLYEKKKDGKPKSELAEMTLNPIRNLKQRKGRLDRAIEESGG